MMDLNEMTDVLVTVRAGVLFVTFNDPENRNALSNSILPAQIAPFVAARVGRHTARHLMLTAARLDASAAAAAGRVDEVVDDASASMPLSTGQSGEFAAPRANAITKAPVNAPARLPLGGLLDHSAEQFAAAMVAAEAKEGVAAFFQRRRPAWAADHEADSGHALRVVSAASNANRPAEDNA